MRTMLLATLFLLLPTAATAADLARSVSASDGWSSWSVPKLAAAGEACCYTIGRRGVDSVGCDLDERSWSISTGHSGGSLKVSPSDHLTVYVHAKGGKVDKIRAYAATCPVKTRDSIRELSGIAPAESAAWLAAEARRKAGSDDDDAALLALAYHADASAETALQQLAAAGQPRQQRETALFWIGQARGQPGVDFVERVARDDADSEMRRHALFVLSQAEEFDTYPKLLARAREDKVGEVRSQAMFWMAQMEDPRAGNDILALLVQERDEEVREQAVFALSQLPDGAGDKALIGVLRGSYPREVKQKALFWLGQSGSDEAIAFLDKMLD